MAMLAMDWADDKGPGELQQFDFVFLVELRKVEDDSSLAQILIQQHSRLKARKVREERIRAVLDGDTERKVLLLFDGYDEYNKGTNTEVDEAIADTIGDCFLIVTSRPRHMEKEIVKEMTGEIHITGLSEDNIVHYATKYLESEEEASNLVMKAVEASIEDLLHIPIILLMVYILYRATESLPRSRTHIMWDIIRLCMDRSAIKHLGKKSSEIPDLEELLFALGELSWLALQKDSKHLLLDKVRLIPKIVEPSKPCWTLQQQAVSGKFCSKQRNLSTYMAVTFVSKSDGAVMYFQDDVAKAGAVLLKLGLLHGSLLADEASLDEQPDWLTYPHKLFQEFMGGYYAALRILRDGSKVWRTVIGTGAISVQSIVTEVHRDSDGFRCLILLAWIPAKNTSFTTPSKYSCGRFIVL